MLRQPAALHSPQLMDAAIGEGDRAERTIDVHIKTLRRKFTPAT
jgi:DNA-binding response OmpR family regulator